MEFNQITIPCSRRVDEYFSLYGLGDIHEGSAGSDTKAIQKLVNEIKNDDRAYWVGMGDYAEQISIKDGRWEARALARKYRAGSIDSICQEQIDSINNLFYPIRDKCCGLLRGNHELAIFRNYGHNVLYEMWKCLNDIKAGEVPRGQAEGAVLNIDTYKNPKVRCLYDAAVIRLTFIYKDEKSRSPWKVSFDVFVTHGTVAGRTDGAKINRIQAILKEWGSVDVVMMGHGHGMPVAPYTTQEFNRYGTLITRKRRGVMTGSWLRTYTQNASGYGERANYPPTEIGTPKIEFNPATMDIRVVV